MSPAADENLALSLRILTEEIAKMGGLVEKMVQASLSALIRHHIPRAKRVVADDAQVDEAQRRVEALAETILAEHKLHDKAIREVVSALRIASDLERIGDHATHIAEMTYYVVEGEALTEERPRGPKTYGLAPEA